jgi:magnesium chelatase family protein
MLACVYACTVIGLEGLVVEVEAGYGQGLPGITIVGLPDAAVQESRERAYHRVLKANSPACTHHRRPGRQGGD